MNTGDYVVPSYLLGPTPLFGATIDRLCEVQGESWRNGETHLRLTDINTGEVFHSPSILWDVRRA